MQHKHFVVCINRQLGIRFAQALLDGSVVVVSKQAVDDEVAAVGDT